MAGFDAAWRNIKTKGEQILNKKTARIKKLRAEASRLASMANKRLQRLEGNQLTDAPAYKSLEQERGKRPRFGIRGKNYNEVQQEMARMRRFLDSTTSTVRGANRVLKEIANNTGIKYKRLSELKAKAKTFFELANKVEQYLRNVEDMGSVYDSTRIFEQVSQYVQTAKIDLSDSENDMEKILKKIIEAMDIYQQSQVLLHDKGKDYTVSGWFQLSDE